MEISVYSPNDIQNIELERLYTHFQELILLYSLQSTRLQQRSSTYPLDIVYLEIGHLQKQLDVSRPWMKEIALATHLKADTFKRQSLRV